MQKKTRLKTDGLPMYGERPGNIFEHVRSSIESLRESRDEKQEAAYFRKQFSALDYRIVGAQKTYDNEDALTSIDTQLKRDATIEQCGENLLELMPAYEQARKNDLRKWKQANWYLSKALDALIDCYLRSCKYEKALNFFTHYPSSRLSDKRKTAHTITSWIDKDHNYDGNKIRETLREHPDLLLEELLSHPSTNKSQIIEALRSLDYGKHDWILSQIEIGKHIDEADCDDALKDVLLKASLRAGNFTNLVNRLSWFHESIERLTRAERAEFIAKIAKIDDYYFFGEALSTIRMGPEDLRILKKQRKINVNQIVKAYIQTHPLALIVNPEFFSLSNAGVFEKFTVESESIRECQLNAASLLHILIESERYEFFKEYLAQSTTEKERVREVVQTIQNFVERYPVSKKGKTVVVLLAAREYRTGIKLYELAEKIAKNLKMYENILAEHEPSCVPDGLRASIGLEYEITKSTAEAYLKLTGRELRPDMQQLSACAEIGQGNDAMHEIATRPVDNPYLLMLEMQLLQDLEFIDFNFERNGYEKGARGYHLTLGGEKGLERNEQTIFLQNSILATGWGGVHGGKNIDFYHTTTIRDKNMAGKNMRKIFSNLQPCVELRGFSLDKREPFERAVLAAFYGAVGIQAVEKYTKLSPDDINLNAFRFPKSAEDFYAYLENENLLKTGIADKKIKEIIYCFVKFMTSVFRTKDDHNANFLDNETIGYLDDKEQWIDAREFGGAENKKKFHSVAGGGAGLKRYIEDIGNIQIFGLFSEDNSSLFQNTLTKITNLFLKPSHEIGGAVGNLIAALSTTKIGRKLEENDPRAMSYSIFETNGKTREGYYSLQGGSEKMLIHAMQTALLDFIKTMKSITH